jgi:hypothetical protein
MPRNSLTGFPHGTTFCRLWREDVPWATFPPFDRASTLPTLVIETVPLTKLRSTSL